MVLAQLENRKEINVVLGDRVKKARLGQRLTREQLAERANVSARFLADVESGVTGVSLSTLRELCLIWDCRPIICWISATILRMMSWNRSPSG